MRYKIVQVLLLVPLPADNTDTKEKADQGHVKQAYILPIIPMEDATQAASKCKDRQEPCWPPHISL